LLLLLLLLLSESMSTLDNTPPTFVQLAPTIAPI
jgi:hypothetical protein